VATQDRGAPWLARATHRLIALISGANVSLSVELLALLAAVALGALHAFAPGHGKTVVGAYLIGSRGTPRHAVFLGLTVTITHTLGVFALGFATLAASRFFVPERLLPALSLVSGLLVLGMGVVLFQQRWRSAKAADASRAVPSYRRMDSAQAAARRSPLRALGPVMPQSGGLAFADGHHHGAYAHPHLHAHGAGPHRHEAAFAHSHGGSLHTHLPPGASGERITWGSLLTLGISGGLVPCPSAMVLLLAAVALNKTAWGLALVLAFSVGLAVSLTAVGLAFLYARNRLPRPSAQSRWPQWLAVASAAAITAVGAAMSWAALVSFSPM
jgi:ABC-type nickel/cobalt efflux system permease component RcnA